MFGKSARDKKKAEADLAIELDTLNCRRKLDALSQRLDSHICDCLVSDMPGTLREASAQLRADYTAFAEGMARRMSSMETIQRELLSKTYEYDRILHALGVKITARAKRGRSVAPPAPKKGKKNVP